MSWRVAKSLDTLRSQINALAPKRNKDWDGTIASTQHHRQNPTSDHEQNSAGVVCAMDITHDPEHGVDSYKLADWLLKTKDARIKYVISNSRIGGDEAYARRNNKKAWSWSRYSGSNHHDHHVHVSVNEPSRVYDNAKEWDLTGFAAKAKPIPVQTIVEPEQPSDHARMAKFILDFEARRDKQGRLAVYPLPPDDGGGTYEVAGINDRYHPKEAAELSKLIRGGRYHDAEKRAREIMIDYTSPVAAWSRSPAVEFFLRDTCFNRGPTGAAKIFQHALGVKMDGSVGPATLMASAQADPAALLGKLRESREWYERNVVGYRARFWKGLVNRWDKAYAAAAEFVSPPPEEAKPETMITVGGHEEGEGV